MKFLRKSGLLLLAAVFSCNALMAMQGGSASGSQVQSGYSRYNPMGYVPSWKSTKPYVAAAALGYLTLSTAATGLAMYRYRDTVANALRSYLNVSPRAANALVGGLYGGLMGSAMGVAIARPAVSLYGLYYQRRLDGAKYFIKRIAQNKPLNIPWGFTLFSKYSKAQLIIDAIKVLLNQKLDPIIETWLKSLLENLKRYPTDPVAIGTAKNIYKEILTD